MTADEVIRKWQGWRDGAQDDVWIICRSDMIILLEEIKRLRRLVPPIKELQS